MTEPREGFELGGAIEDIEERAHVRAGKSSTCTGYSKRRRYLETGERTYTYESVWMEKVLVIPPPGSFSHVNVYYPTKTSPVLYEGYDMGDLDNDCEPDSGYYVTTGGGYTQHWYNIDHVLGNATCASGTVIFSNATTTETRRYRALCF